MSDFNGRKAKDQWSLSRTDLEERIGDSEFGYQGSGSCEVNWVERLS